MVPGHDHTYYVWPLLHLRQTNGIGTTNLETLHALLPFYAITDRSPQRDNTAIFWPFFCVFVVREKKYHEWEGPWPVVIFTHGETETSRIFPLFQPIAQCHPGNRFLSLAVIFIHPFPRRPLGSGTHAPGLVSSTTGLSQKKNYRNRQGTRAGGHAAMWPFLHLAPGNSMATGACKSWRRSNLPCPTIPASNATGPRSGPSGAPRNAPKPAPPASPCSGICTGGTPRLITQRPPPSSACTNTSQHQMRIPSASFISP